MEMILKDIFKDDDIIFEVINSMGDSLIVFLIDNKTKEFSEGTIFKVSSYLNGYKIIQTMYVYKPESIPPESNNLTEGE